MGRRVAACRSFFSPFLPSLGCVILGWWLFLGRWTGSWVCDGGKYRNEFSEDLNKHREKWIKQYLGKNLEPFAPFSVPCPYQASCVFTERICVFLVAGPKAGAAVPSLESRAGWHAVVLGLAKASPGKHFKPALENDTRLTWAGWITLLTDKQGVSFFV